MIRGTLLPRLAAVLAAASLPALAADYWVSTTGNDGNPGTQGQPWRTIQRAVSAVAPGDTVHVTNGTYVGWATDVSGSPGSPITWRAEGNSVVVNQPPPSGPGNPDDNIRLMYANYNVIDGFQSTSAPRAGIAVRGDDVTPIVGSVVRNCRSFNNDVWGIFDAFADNCLYENNETSGSCEQHGIYHSNSGDGTIIRFNLVFGNGAAGLHNNGDISQGGDGICSNLQIVGNIIYGNGAGSSCTSGGGASINMDGVQDSLIANNMIYEASASGIIGYQIDAAAPARNNVIVNNTVMMHDSGGRWALKLVDGSSGCTVFNNILYRNHGFRGSISVDPQSLVGLTSDFNVVVDRFSTDADNTNMTLAQWRQQTGQDMSSILMDSSQLGTYFVNPGGGDYHLRAGSPAIDAGAASLAGENAPATDYEGDARPAGAGFDVGADEYGQAGPTAQFTGNPLSGPAPLTVQFTDQSTGGVTGWSWAFGDGGTSTAQNPSHVYNAVGSYTVSLTVTSPAGNDSEVKPGYVTVTGSSPIENFFSGRGRAASNPNDVRVHSLGGVQEAAWSAYGAGQWGTLVAGGDIDASGLGNPITGPGPGPVYGPQVRAFQPNGTAISKVNFYAYGTLRYGVNVSAGLLDGDAAEEMLTGAGPGAVFGPHVRGWNFDGASLAAISKVSFFAYGTLKYGVNVSRADLEQDGYQELLTGPGPGAVFGPQVRGFNYDATAVTAMAKVNFNAFTGGNFGVNVAGGSVDGDGFEELAAGRGMAVGLTAQIRGFNYDNTTITALPGFDTTLVGGAGAHPALGDVDGDAVAELVAGPGEDPTSPSSVSTFDYTGAALTPLSAGTFAAFTGGAYGVVPATSVLGF